jgi:uncharacterized protein
MKYIHKIAYTLTIIGGLNWGLVGLVSTDLVDALFGSVPLIARLIYVAVGLSSLYILITFFMNKNLKCCDSCTCTTCEVHTDISINKDSVTQ